MSLFFERKLRIDRFIGLKSTIFYFCARNTKYKAIAVKTKLGNQIPNITGIDCPVAKTMEKRDKKIKIAPRPTPIARCKPIPPLTFRAAIDTPMMVSMKIVKGSAVLR